MTSEQQRSELAELYRLRGETQNCWAPILAAVQADPFGPLPRLPNDVYERSIGAIRRELMAVARYQQSWVPHDLADEPPVKVPFLADILVKQIPMLADSLLTEGQPARAQSILDEAMDVATHFLGPAHVAALHRASALRLATAGRFNQALSTLDQARQTLEAGAGSGAESGIDPITARIDIMQGLLMAANIYEWLGDTDRAWSRLTMIDGELAELCPRRPTDADLELMFQRAMTGADPGQEEAQREVQWGLAFQSIHDLTLAMKARLNIVAKEYAAAEHMLIEARRNAERSGLGPGADMHLARCAIGQQRFLDADELLDGVADFAARVPLARGRQPAIRAAQSQVALCLQRPIDAEGIADEGLALLQEYPDADATWKLYWRRAQARRAQGRYPDALTDFVTAATTADDLRKAPLGYRLDTTFLRDKLDMFTEAIDLSLSSDVPAVTGLLVELVKARTLAAILGVPLGERPERGADELVFDELCARIDGLDYQIQTESDVGPLKRERRALLQQREEVLERIRISDPRWRSLSVPALRAPADTLALLASRDQAAISLFRQPGRLIAICYHAGGITTHIEPLDSTTETAIRKNAVNVRRGATPIDYDVSDPDGLELGLERLLPASMLDIVTTASALIIVPHGPLHLLPWAAMTWRGRRLFQYLPVAVLPNLSSLHNLDADPLQQPLAALVGDPDYSGLAHFQQLPEAGAEIAEIAAVYGPRLLAPEVTGSRATESAVWQLADMADAGRATLHLACHGTIDGDSPLACGLVLTRSTLEAAEVSSRRLPFPEVVLSACSTGWRPGQVADLELIGDDALGLTASFLEAGARFVLVSIPRAHDGASREFMGRFHTHRASGLTPLAAMAATQNDLLAEGTRPIWQWAGLVAYGCR